MFFFVNFNLSIFGLRDVIELKNKIPLTDK